MRGRTTGAAPRNLRAVTLDWTGQGMVFRGRGSEPATPEIVLDGDGAAGPSPMLALLLAAASCSASDVVLILEKMRVALERLTVEVEGVRRDEEPRRYVALHFSFRMAGAGLDHAKAERAVSLSLEKYCSVVHTLAPDVAVTHDVVLG